MHADEAVSSKQTCSQTPSKLQFVLRLLEWYCGSLSTRSGVVYDWLGLYKGSCSSRKPWAAIQAEKGFFYLDGLVYLYELCM